MKHILSNPHNGAIVDHEGVHLHPGFEQHVRPELAQVLLKAFGFLLVRVVPGAETPPANAKPVKIKGTLTWAHGAPVEPDMETGEHDPQPQHVQHVVEAGAKKRAPAKPRSKKK